VRDESDRSIARAGVAPSGNICNNDS